MTERERLAFEWNTLPRFVYQNKAGEWRSFEYDVATLPEIVNPFTYYRESNEGARVPLSLSESDVVLFYILGNARFRQLMEDLKQDTFFAANVLQLDESEAGVLFSLWKDIRAPRDYEDLLRGIGAEKEEFRREHAQRARWLTELNSADPYPFEEFSTRVTSNIYTFENPATLMKLFDDVQVSREIPLIATRNFYKVVNQFPYSLEVPTEEKILFAFSGNGRIVVEDVGSPAAPLFRATLDEKALPSFKRAFRPAALALRGQDSVGTFDLITPQMAPTFDKVLWADVIMINPVLAADFVIDEHVNATKTAAGLYMFYVKGDRRIPFILLETLRQKPNTPLRELVVQVKVLSLRDLEAADIKEFQEKLARALGYYAKKARTLQGIYNSLLTVPIKLVRPKELPDKVRLKNVAAEMFPPKYSRTCQFTPAVVTDVDARRLERAGFQVMIFPKTAEEGAQFFFSCAQHEKHIYTGLRVNRLSNKNEFPLLPCCYRDDQRTKKTNFRAYYEGLENDRDRKEDTRRHLITDKFVKYNQTGVMPDFIQHLTFLLGNADVIRRGVNDTPSSVLECILYRTFPENLSAADRVKAVRRERARLAALPTERLNVARQEMYNMSEEVFRARLADETEYLDPARYYSLLEAEYKCRLVVLIKSGFQPPVFSGAFLKVPRPDPIIIVYENEGSEFQKGQYPRCEMVENILEPEKVYKIFEEMIQAYRVDSLGRLSRPIFSLTNVQPTIAAERAAQHLDLYGKCFALNIRALGRVSTFYLDQVIPPLSLPIADAFYDSEDERHVIEVAGMLVAGYFKKSSATSSILEAYLNTTEQVQLLTQNAIRRRALGEKITSAAAGRVEEFSKDEWARAFAAPSAEIARRLDYVVDLFQKQHPATFAEYPEYKCVPFEYRNPLDFSEQTRATIAEIGNWLVWAEPVNKVYSDEVFAAPNEPTFFIQIEEVVYFCSDLSADKPAAAAAFYLWNSRTVVATGEPAEGGKYLVVAAPSGGDPRFYRMHVVVSR